ncbi:MAG: hypothetical protein Q7N50_08340 [Armatimonadota bacterium]|nr:hypothetical protein [Armatimonadota bacterium]
MSDTETINQDHDKIVASAVEKVAQAAVAKVVEVAAAVAENERNIHSLYKTMCDQRFSGLENWQTRQNGSLQKIEVKLGNISNLITGLLISLVLLLFGVIANLFTKMI